jgi:hypothetical protein
MFRLFGAGCGAGGGVEAEGACADSSAGVRRHAATKASRHGRVGKLKRGKSMMFSLLEDELAVYS